MLYSVYYSHHVRAIKINLVLVLVGTIVLYTMHDEAVIHKINTCSSL